MRSKVRSRTPMKPSALARGARRQPASACAPFRTAAHARFTLAPATTRHQRPHATPPQRQHRLPPAYHPRSPRSSSHPPAQQPAHNPTAPPREPRTIPAMPAAKRTATQTPHGTHEPSPHGCSWPWRSAGEAEKPEQPARAHYLSSPGAPPRTSRPRGCSLLALSPASTSPAPASCPRSRPLFCGPPLPRALSASWHMPCKLSCNAAHLCNAAHMQCSTPFGQRCSCCGLVLRPARAGMGWTLSLNRCPQGLVVRGNMSP
jgi:hypothetical protein